MLQTVFFIPREIAGLPVFGFGLLLAVWVVFSFGLLAWLAWRQGFCADTWSYLPLLGLVAAVIWFLLPVLCEARGLPIRGFGMMLLMALAAGTGLAVWRAQQIGISADVVVSLAFWLILPGVIAARVSYLAEYWFQQFWPVYLQSGGGRAGLAALLAAMINVPQGGLIVYGSFVGGMLGLAAFIRQYRLPFLVLGDLIAPSAMLGLALGRIGCTLNGCCYGGPCDLPWAVTFPPDSFVHFHQVEHGETFIHGLRLGGDQEGRPVVLDVEAGSPAERAGVSAHQHITRINGAETRTVAQAALLLLGANKVSVATVGSRFEAQWPIEFADVGGQEEFAPPDLRRIEQGQEFIHDLKIGGDAEDRPVIVAVRPHSPAEKQGLKPQQQIAQINGQPVATVVEAARALARANRLSVETTEHPAASQWTIVGPTPANEPVQPVHPTQIYDSISAILLCLLLLAYGPFQRRDGELFALMMTGYPVSRFLVEMIRTDEDPVRYTGLTVSQNLSLLLLVCATVLWLYIVRSGRKPSSDSPLPLAGEGEG